MSWRLEINHVTRYHYDRPVVSSYNEARVTPLDNGAQRVIEASVAVKPATETFCFHDYWGSFVHAFDVHDPHGSLVVTGRAVVETGLVPPPGSEAVEGDPAPGGWADLATPETEDRFYELLAPCSLVSPSALAGVASGIRSASATPGEAVEAAVGWAHSELEYGAGSTHVGTSASEAWEAGRGVCQDFAHLTLGVLRALGIPARYVSGYFHPKATAAVGTRVTGESHAWVEAWTGSWASYDPTNLVPVGERHVVVARGRDYADVAPLRGIYSGPPGSSTEVTVELTRRA